LIYTTWNTVLPHHWTVNIGSEESERHVNVQLKPKNKLIIFLEILWAGVDCIHTTWYRDQLRAFVNTFFLDSPVSYTCTTYFYARLILSAFSVYSSTLKTETVFSSETSLNFYTTRHHNPLYSKGPSRLYEREIRE
jgi:hypothetical protein